MDNSNPGDSTFEIQQQRQKSKKIAVSLLLTLFLSMAPMAVANACQGNDLQKSKQIIEQAWIMGTQLANQIVYGQVDIMSALNYMIQQTQYLNAQAASLPYSCQVLIQQWSNAIAQATGGGGLGGGTQCMSGVCCDGTGCY